MKVLFAPDFGFGASAASPKIELDIVFLPSHSLSLPLYLQVSVPPLFYPPWKKDLGQMQGEAEIALAEEDINYLRGQVNICGKLNF